VVAGLAVGWLTALAMLQTVDPQATFGDLAAYVVGLLVGVGVAVLVWLVGLARAARRLFAPGRRLGVLAASAGATFLVAVAAGAVASGLADTPTPGDVGSLVSAVAVLAVPLAPVAVFLLWDRRTPATSDAGTYGELGPHDEAPHDEAPHDVVPHEVTPQPEQDRPLP
jgi:hypothetical protein